MSRTLNALYGKTAFLCAAALMFAACSENTTTTPTRGIAPDAVSQDQYSEFDGPGGQGHIFRTRDWYARNAAKPSSGTGIYYHGGSVLQAATNVVAVYWASSPIYVSGPAAGTHDNSGNSGDKSLVGDFLRGLTNSSYFAINTTYYDANNNHIDNIVNYTGYWANNSNVPANGASVSDGQMVSMLQAGFDSGTLVYDPSTLYAIFTAGTVNLGGGFGTQYCAYHTHGTVTINGQSRTVLYAAMPYDYAYPSACTNGSAAANGNTDPGADAEVNTLAHETEETTTDMMGNAWYDRRGYENADKCAWKFGTTYTTSSGGVANTSIGGHDFLIQMNWVNAGSGGCAIQYP